VEAPDGGAVVALIWVIAGAGMMDWGSVCDGREEGVGCLRIHSGPKCIVVVVMLQKSAFRNQEDLKVMQRVENREESFVNDEPLLFRAPPLS
jgi:hypothetical protein